MGSIMPPWPTFQLFVMTYESGSMGIRVDDPPTGVTASRSYSRVQKNVREFD